MANLAEARAEKSSKKNVGAGPCACPRAKYFRYRATTGGCPYKADRDSAWAEKTRDKGCRFKNRDGMNLFECQKIVIAADHTINISRNSAFQKLVIIGVP